MTTLPSSKDVIRNKKTGHTYRITGDGNGRMAHYWMLRVLNPNGTVAPSTAMLAHNAWSSDWEVI